MLDDIIPPNCRLLICGTAVGKGSARKNQYYAGNNNKFWKVMADFGFIPRNMHETDYDGRILALINAGIGLTDIVKSRAGMDKNLKANDYNIKDFIEIIQKHKPKIVCFNGKKAAEAFFHKSLSYGKYVSNAESLSYKPLFYIAPSTSAQAVKYWDPNKWKDLSELLSRI